MREINILEKSHPQIKRNTEQGFRTQENKKIAKLYGKDFFDGDRANGYGGYYYDGRWKKVVEALKKLYGINENSSVLDIGCAKGFLLFDLQEMIPGIRVAGLDISEYVLNKAMDRYGRWFIENNPMNNNYSWEADIIEQKSKNKVLPFMIKGSANKLPWPDNSFDTVISINTIHNLPIGECKKAIKEIMRVCKPNGHKFITVDAYRNQEEKERMDKWVLTAETVMSVNEWIEFFKDANYNGDYYWFIA